MKIVHILTLLIGIAWLFGIFNIHYVLPMIAVDHLIEPETLKTISLEEQSEIVKKLRAMYEPSILPTLGAIAITALGAIGVFNDLTKSKKSLKNRI